MDARKELKARADDLGISFPSVFADFNGKPASRTGGRRPVSERTSGTARPAMGT